MKPHKDAPVHHAAGEWARGTQHRTNQFSQLKIQASGLNYACKRIVRQLDGEKYDPKKIIIWKEQDRLIRPDRRVVTDFPHNKF